MEALEGFRLEFYLRKIPNVTKLKRSIQEKNQIHTHDTQKIKSHKKLKGLRDLIHEYYKNCGKPDSFIELATEEDIFY